MAELLGCARVGSSYVSVEECETVGMMRSDERVRCARKAAELPERYGEVKVLLLVLVVVGVYP